MQALPLVRHDPAAVFAWREGQAVTARQFVCDAARLAAALPACRHVINLCSDRYRFAVSFAASLLRGQTTLMPPNQTRDFLARLQRDYPDIYQLTDDLVADNSAAADAAGEVPVIAADHVAAIMFTSGSTGEPQPHPKLWGALVRSAAAELERFAALVRPGMTL